MGTASHPPRIAPANAPAAARGAAEGVPTSLAEIIQKHWETFVHRHVPEGYQDESGFYFGKPPQPRQSTGSLDS